MIQVGETIVGWLFLCQGADFYASYYIDSSTDILLVISEDDGNSWSYHNISSYVDRYDIHCDIEYDDDNDRYGFVWTQGTSDGVDFHDVGSDDSGVGLFSFFYLNRSTISFVSINGLLNNSRVDVGSRFFNWTLVDDPELVGYQLQISNDSGFTDVFVDLDDINESNYGVNYTELGGFVEFILPSEYDVVWLGPHYYRVRGRFYGTGG